ncbi:hypothetical protein CA13_11650 [Planctomycetes bacterium CA13]|uniref:Uncharacterized protein n=1 Tax=Novipirellula herctigrandis TaxID=2527986 RepID=A0A5C5YXG5_9BACT|nr:hypothetical protein CA13_11650 [Planctomycetes bacterium CA13]
MKARATNLQNDINPYEPTAITDDKRPSRSVRLPLAAGALGFLAGTATHWVLFWTDTFSTEFPPMGGALLGIIAAVLSVYASLRRPRLFLAIGFILGNINAFFCRPPFVINPFNDIPRDFGFSWSFAAIAFVVAGYIAYEILRTVKRWGDLRQDIASESTLPTEHATSNPKHNLD